MHKALEKGNKMFQKLVETRFLKEAESIYSTMTRQKIDRNEIKKK